MRQRLVACNEASCQCLAHLLGLLDTLEVVEVELFLTIRFIIIGTASIGGHTHACEYLLTQHHVILKFTP